MIVGIGMDIVEISRVRKAVEKEAFIRRVFTEAEADYCRSRGVGMAASFAGRFAAKEALLKALGTGLREGKLTELEILNDELGCPRLRLSGRFKEMADERGAQKYWVSITHSLEYAAAQCILES